MRYEIARCGVCGVPVPRLARSGPARRYCSDAHRQVAYRMRRAAGRSPAGRGASAAAERRAARDAASELAVAASAARASLGQGAGPGAAAVAGLAALAARLERAAVAADRAAGASWAQVGAALGVPADTARRRYGKRLRHYCIMR
jgi:hypothetical protein